MIQRLIFDIFETKTSRPHI